MAVVFEVSSDPTAGDNLIVSGYVDKTVSVPGKFIFTYVVPVNYGSSDHHRNFGSDPKGLINLYFTKSDP